MIRHGGPTGPAPLGWGDDRYDPGRVAADFDQTRVHKIELHEFDETAWWGDCANTWHEEEKQHVVAARLGLIAEWSCAHPPSYDIEGRSVLDIGGGPVSLLLKCLNRGRCTVMDPGQFPEWVIARYVECGIAFDQRGGEHCGVPYPEPYDEVWIYNTLQHVVDPSGVIAAAWRVTSTIRIFEWIDIDPYPGHLHKLTSEQLNGWLDGRGFATELNERGCVGRAYYGVFGKEAT